MSHLCLQKQQLQLGQEPCGGLPGILTETQRCLWNSWNSQALCDSTRCVEGEVSEHRSHNHRAPVSGATA